MIRKTILEAFSLLETEKDKVMKRICHHIQQTLLLIMQHTLGVQRKVNLEVICSIRCWQCWDCIQQYKYMKNDG